MGDPWAIAESFIYLGYLEYSEGNFDQAIAAWKQALFDAHAQQSTFFMAYCLTGLAASVLQKAGATGLPSWQAPPTRSSKA